MIKLSELLKEQDTFTAISKKTGQTSVFKTKDARDSAIKGGTHSKTKEKGDSKKSGKGGVNIFDKPKKDEPKSEPKSQSMDDLLDKYDSSFSSVEMVSDLVKGDLSAEDLVKVARHHNINLTSDIVQKQLDSDGAKKYAYQNKVSDKEAISRLEKLRDTLKAEEKAKKDSGTQKSLFPDEKPDSKPTDDSNKIKDPKGMSKVVPKEIGTDVDKMEDWLYDRGGSIGDGQTYGLSDENQNKLYNLFYKYEDAKESGDKKEIERTKKDYIEFVYNNLEKNQNKPKGPEAKDYWNSDKKPAPKVEKFKTEPTEKAIEGLDTLSTMSIGGTNKLTPEDMGDKEYERNMLRMIFDSLESANFHTHNRFIMADLEGNQEKRNKPNYSDAPDLGSPEYQDWSEKNSIFTSDFKSQFNRKNERDDVLSRGAEDISKNSDYDGNQIVAAYLQKLRKDGKDDLANRIQKSFEDAEKSMDESTTSLRDLLPESIINEGTRSQVGVIGRNGKIVSAYVHYDGYPSNMKPGLKHHMKNDKDVLKLIKMGGARGIFNDKDIEYYKSGKPMKGDFKNIEGYIKDADMKQGAEYVYLYNMKDKKWYYADTYKDSKLKKLF